MKMKRHTYMYMYNDVHILYILKHKEGKSSVQMLEL